MPTELVKRICLIVFFNRIANRDYHIVSQLQLGQFNVEIALSVNWHICYSCTFQSVTWLNHLFNVQSAFSLTKYIQTSDVRHLANADHGSLVAEIRIGERGLDERAPAET